MRKISSPTAETKTVSTDNFNFKPLQSSQITMSVDCPINTSETSNHGVETHQFIDDQHCIQSFLSAVFQNRLLSAATKEVNRK
ncbi:hypothetical protein QQP08_008326 [Theobroma cacao]|nr:hypothetical protein QQP08_008326 [Theobroma cacao]